MRKPIDTGAWARHAFAANGFGDAVTAGDMASGRAATRVVITTPVPAGASRLLASAWRRLGEGALALRERHRRWRDARAVYDALRQLDDRALHDLGFDRSELSSVAREATGGADYTRAHAMLSSYELLR